ncbi:GtrA family protein [Ammoniphilus sp. YIM 78166]|uniref:GtrA family protein n=1 Tax=Ammoniphilus sp. YIM 78166 TaxID=1644106 RepID=UPI00106FF7EB|nr:GtrA family protein [Ammoniphilus sp. YIM 78166]
MEISRALIAKLIRYTFIGGLTTLVSFGVFWLLYGLIKVNTNLANTISVISAVIFAYITNKLFVFQSRCNSTRELLHEFFKFIFSRAFTMVVEIGGVFILYTLLGLEAMMAKILVSVVVLVMNYILSQFIIFKQL